jgi:hypothetical protein
VGWPGAGECAQADHACVLLNGFIILSFCTPHQGILCYGVPQALATAREPIMLAFDTLVMQLRSTKGARDIPQVRPRVMMMMVVTWEGGGGGRNQQTGDSTGGEGLGRRRRYEVATTMTGGDDSVVIPSGPKGYAQEPR